MRTRREVIGVLGSGREEHRAWVEPLARWVAQQGYHLLTGAGGDVPGAGTVSEAVLALRYGKPLILFGPREAFGAFPAELERTESLERVCTFLRSVLGQGAASSG